MRTTDEATPLTQEDLCPARWARLGQFGDGELRDKLVVLFRMHAPCRIHAVEEAFRKTDLQALAEVSHSLKSSAGNLGLIRIQELSGRIEEDARDGRTGRLDALVRDLQAGFARIRAWLESAAEGETR